MWDPQEIEHIILSRGWRPIGKVSKPVVALEKLLRQAGIEDPAVHVEALIKFVGTMTAAMPRKSRECWRQRLVEDVFLMVVFTRSQNKDYIRKLRKARLSFLKIDKTSKEVDLLDSIADILNLKDEAAKSGLRSGALARMTEVHSEIRSTLGLPEDENSEERLEKAWRKRRSGALNGGFRAFDVVRGPKGAKGARRISLRPSKE